MAKTFSILSVLSGILVAIAGVFLHMSDTSLIKSFELGAQSPELFRLPNGVNEFDLLRINGIYYFASDDKTETQLRSASSVHELVKAPAFIPVPNGRYPSIQYSSGTWHLWLWFGDESLTRHFSSSKFEGPYEARDALPLGLADIHVRKARDGRYFAAYKDLRDGAQLASGLLTATSLDGPWKDLGHIFTNSRDAWHAGEEADPAFFDRNGKSYVTFAGWNGLDPAKDQKIGIVEVDPRTGKAIGSATVLLEAKEPWHLRNGQHKLFNPVFLCDGGRSRLFFAQNVSASGVPAGWGYVEANAGCRR